MKTIQLLRLISIINSLLIIPACSAQNPSESLLEDVLEDLSVNNGTDNSVNTPNWENELEELSNRMQEPVNLNVATREQLEQFPFLSDIQIEHLLVKSIGSTLASVLGAMEPVTAVCVGIFLFGEAFTTSIGVGIALIIAAVIVIILKR